MNSYFTHRNNTYKYGKNINSTNNAERMKLVLINTTHLMLSTCTSPGKIACRCLELFDSFIKHLTEYTNYQYCYHALNTWYLFTS